jgi:hypothetical protein
VRSSFLADPGARFWRGKLSFGPTRKKLGEERIKATTIASLRPEHDETRSAVEMPPRGKRGKLKNRVSPSFHRAWKSGQKPNSGFPHYHRAGGGIDISFWKGEKKSAAGIEFQLTDPGHFKHDKNVSVASLRS